MQKKWRNHTEKTKCHRLPSLFLISTIACYSRASVLGIGVISPSQVHLDHLDCEAKANRENFSLSTGFLECGTNVTFTTDQSKLIFHQALIMMKIHHTSWIWQSLMQINRQLIDQAFLTKIVFNKFNWFVLPFIFVAHDLICPTDLISK